MHYKFHVCGFAHGNFNLYRVGIILESAPTVIFCLVTETEGQTFRKIPGFYLTSGYTAVIFAAHLVTMKCQVFTTTSTGEIQLCARPATQLMDWHTRSPPPLLPADRACQSVAHARRFNNCTGASWAPFLFQMTDSHNGATMSARSVIHSIVC